MYHTIVCPPQQFAVIRDASSGINDLEFEAGCRMLGDLDRSQATLGKMLMDETNFTLLTIEEWNEFLSTKMNPNNSSHTMKSTYNPFDKWDVKREPC